MSYSTDPCPNPVFVDPMSRLLPVICGPTASGKTAVAVSLAKRLGGEIISADSMQIYRGMDILSAIPTEKERGGIRHHMLGFADPSEKYSAAMYGAEAKRLVAGIRARGRLPIVCGGTGLYIDALTRPMRFSEKSDDALHAELMAMADEPGGKTRLHDMLKAVDPQSAARLHENDVRRVARAIEIYRLTGKTQTEQNAEDRLRKGDFDERLFAPDWPRDVLYRRIDRRVDTMLEAGLIDEVRRLLNEEDRYPTAAQAIGYKEIAAALLGRTDMDEAILSVKQATRNFAKRQLTWLRRDGRVTWIPAQNRSPEEIAEEITERLEESL